MTRISLWLLALLAAFAASASARDLSAFGEPLAQVGAKASGHTWGNTSGAKSLSAALPGATGNAQAPFTAGARDPILDILLGAEAAPATSRSACVHSTTDFCYDLSDRRIVYRPAREYMPRLEGFVAESVSLRRNAIRFKYSFR